MSSLIARYISWGSTVLLCRDLRYFFCSEICLLRKIFSSKQIRFLSISSVWFLSVWFLSEDDNFYFEFVFSLHRSWKCHEISCAWRDPRGNTWSVLSSARNTFVDYLAYPDIPLAHEFINITIAVGVEIVVGNKLVDGVPVCFDEGEKKI